MFMRAERISSQMRVTKTERAAYESSPSILITASVSLRSSSTTTLPSRMASGAVASSCARLKMPARVCVRCVWYGWWGV